MVQSVSYLNIKPYEAYSGKSHKTTLRRSKFGDILKKEEAASKDVVSEDTDKTTEKASADTATKSADATVVYKDPLTGKNVVYQDVSEDEKEKTTSSVSKSSSANTTDTAQSMKKTKYDAYFKEAAKKYNVSESLLKAIAKAESNFNAKDVSSTGAMGVMQLMPETAKSLGVDNPYDPEQNIMGGAKCISQKLKEFNGDVKLALAAYNAGSGAVKRNGGVPSYCRSYVSKVLSYKAAFETAAAVG